MCKLQNLARAFDQPVDSPEHRRLKDEVWLGGDLIVVRYWLGRLCRRNLFREHDDLVSEELNTFLTSVGCSNTSTLASDPLAWHPIAKLLRHTVESTEGTSRDNDYRLAVAIREILAKPWVTDAELAAIAMTTEKQIKRMSDVSLLRKLWKRHAFQ